MERLPSPANSAARGSSPALLAGPAFARKPPSDTRMAVPLSDQISRSCEPVGKRAFRSPILVQSMSAQRAASGMDLRIEARLHFTPAAEQNAAPRRIDRLHFAHAIRRLRRLQRSITIDLENPRRSRATTPLDRTRTTSFKACRRRIGRRRATDRPQPFGLDRSDSAVPFPPHL